MVKFDRIEDLVADIAVVFNWPPAEIFMMNPGEVVAWREQAALRSGARDNEKILISAFLSARSINSPVL
ncbi:GpE family phage tail protein [Salmonella enterica subsp. enterica serovar Adjame]|nr:GpE family phage tail protein [Salmonella enterica subsp. enterica serovar Adjame]